MNIAVKNRGFATLIGLVVTVAIICLLSVYVLKPMFEKSGEAVGSDKTGVSATQSARDAVKEYNQQANRYFDEVENITDSD